MATVPLLYSKRMAFVWQTYGFCTYIVWHLSGQQVDLPRIGKGVNFGLLGETAVESPPGARAAQAAPAMGGGVAPPWLQVRFFPSAGRDGLAPILRLLLRSSIPGTGKRYDIAVKLIVSKISISVFLRQTSKVRQIKFWKFNIILIFHFLWKIAE